MGAAACHGAWPIEIRAIVFAFLTLIQRFSAKPDATFESGRPAMATLLRQRPKKTVYERGAVTCRKCAAPIYVFKLKPLSDEFSVQCSKCGDRGIYFKRDVSVDILPERRKKPRS